MPGDGRNGRDGGTAAGDAGASGGRSSAFFDVDGDDYLENAGWVSADDGLLVYDGNERGNAAVNTTTFTKVVVQQKMLLFVFLISIFICSGIAYSVELDEKNKEALKDIVFLKDESGEYRIDKLFRWTKPKVNVGFLYDNGDVPAGAISAIVEFAKEAYIPNTIEITASENESADVLFVFVEDIFTSAKTSYRDVFERVFPEGSRGVALDNFVNMQRDYMRNCFSYAGASLEVGLTGSVVFVSSTTEPVIIKRCIALEGLRSLGLLGYTTDPDVDSLMSSVNQILWMTETDKIFLKILYDKRLKTGMTRDVALPIIRQILTEIRPGAWQQNVCDNC